MTFPFLSMVVFLMIPALFNLLARCVAVFGFKKKWPPIKPLCIELFVSVLINGTLGIGIGMVLKTSGASEKFFFRPSLKDYGELVKIDHSKTAVKISSGDRELDGVILMPANKVPDALILHFHEGFRNISHTIKNVNWLVDHGFAVMAFDYSGYGKSTGPTSMSNLIEDGRSAIRESRNIEQVKDLPLVLFGQSMGGQLAIISAALETPNKCLIVSESTYADARVHASDKMSQLGFLWLFKWIGYLATNNEFIALDYIEKISPDKFLLAHGGRDTDILPKHGKALFDATQDKAQSIFPDHLGHLDIFTKEQYRLICVSFIRDKLNLISKSIDKP